MSTTTVNVNQGYGLQPDESSEPSVTVNVLLTVVTLGIWQLIWTYKAMHLYRQQSGRARLDLKALFWVYVGMHAGTTLMTLFHFQPALYPYLIMIAATVAYGFLLNEILIDRTTAAKRGGFSGLMLHSKATMLWLFIISEVLAYTIIGLIVAIPLLTIFLAFLFADHNRFVAATRQLV